MMLGSEKKTLKFVDDEEWCLLIPVGAPQRTVRASIISCDNKYSVAAVVIEYDAPILHSFRTPSKTPSQHGHLKDKRSRFEESDDSFGTHSEMSSSYSLLLAAPADMKVCLVVDGFINGGIIKKEKHVSEI